MKKTREMSRKGEKISSVWQKDVASRVQQRQCFPISFFFSLSYCCFVFQRMEKTKSNMLRNSRSSVEAEVLREKLKTLNVNGHDQHWVTTQVSQWSVSADLFNMWHTQQVVSQQNEKDSSAKRHRAKIYFSQTKNQNVFFHFAVQAHKWTVTLWNLSCLCWPTSSRLSSFFLKCQNC